jgi:hypothetical protein
MSRLAQALLANREEIERELLAAEAELEELRQREAELLSLIDRARGALGLTGHLASGESKTMSKEPRLTLHDALVRLLRESGNRGMTAAELADAVNASGLYSKRDGSPVDVGQIYARTHNYARLFDRDSGRIRARPIA